MLKEWVREPMVIGIGNTMGYSGGGMDVDGDEGKRGDEKGK